jgi:ribonuclease R
MTELGEHCSLSERRADEAVRDVMIWLKCEYLQDRVGEVFDGIISGVTGFGLFIEIQEIYADGLVHVSSLQNDYYHFDASGRRLVGERTRRVYRLGDRVRVRIVRVDLDERKIDLQIDDGAGDGVARGTRGSARKQSAVGKKPAKSSPPRARSGSSGKRGRRR